MGKSILDTSLIIGRVKNGEEIKEDITSFSLVEFPEIKYYSKFHGNVVFSTPEDYRRASETQEEFKKRGKPLSAVDLLVATICVRKGKAC